jgi:hypothetical protein
MTIASPRPSASPNDLAGGKDNGAPGLRPDYGDNYYAAFVIGPDGHNVEAVTQRAG